MMTIKIVDVHEFRRKIGGQLIYLRGQVGMFQNAVEQAMQVGRGSLSKIENGHRPITIERLYELSDALGVTPLTTMLLVLKATGDFKDIPIDLREKLALFAATDIYQSSQQPGRVILSGDKHDS